MYRFNNRAAVSVGRASVKARKMRGFTLIEIMVAIAVLGVISAYAIPSFLNMSKHSQVRSTSLALVSSFNLARSRAMTSKTTVSVCASSNGTSCDSGASGAWEKGWLVFTDNNEDGVLDSDDVLQYSESRPPLDSIAVTQNFADGYVSFDRNGRLVTMDTYNIAVCMGGTGAEIAYAISLTSVGKSSMVDATGSEQSACISEANG